MIVGVPRERKENENRVAVTPGGVMKLSERGHTVLVESRAGLGSGISDQDYREAGAEIVSVDAVFSRSSMVVKVKEPLSQEYARIKPSQIVFTYFHFASSEELVRAMMRSGATCIGYETVEVDGRFPLLEPMSEIAGKMAAQVAAHYLCKTCGGRGVLMSGVAGVAPAKVVVIGGGTVGRNAALLAKSMGADVTVLERKGRAYDHLKRNHPDLGLIESNPQSLLGQLKEADAVIGAVYVRGAKTPRLISRDMVRQMKSGSVLIDVSIDQGGVAETSRPTTHNDPVYSEEGVLHYCVANMPAAFPLTSTFALSNTTLPYVMDLAEKGLDAFKENPALRAGLSILRGKVTDRTIAKQFDIEYIDPSTITLFSSEDCL